MSTAYLVGGVRTPFGRYGGALAGVRPDDVAAHVLSELTNQLPTADLDQLDDVLLGCADEAGEDNRNVARMAALLAGLPVTAPGATINRLRGSGLDAGVIAACTVRSGDVDLVLAAEWRARPRQPPGTGHHVHRRRTGHLGPARIRVTTRMFPQGETRCQ